MSSVGSIQFPRVLLPTNVIATCNPVNRNRYAYLQRRSLGRRSCERRGTRRGGRRRRTQGMSKHLLMRPPELVHETSVLLALGHVGGQHPDDGATLDLSGGWRRGQRRRGRRRRDRRRGRRGGGRHGRHGRRRWRRGLRQTLLGVSVNIDEPLTDMAVGPVASKSNHCAKVACNNNFSFLKTETLEFIHNIRTNDPSEKYYAWRPK